MRLYHMYTWFPTNTPVVVEGDVLEEGNGPAYGINWRGNWCRLDTFSGQKYTLGKPALKS